MKYVINSAGERVVSATPEETRALRPAIRAGFRHWKASDADAEDCIQDVELITWIAIVEKRIPAGRFARPVDALRDFMFAVSWNLWRNLSRKRARRSEVIFDEFADMSGPSPERRLEARETLLRLTAYPKIAALLLDAVNVEPAIRYADTPRSTYSTRLTNARKIARYLDSERYREPKQPAPSTPKLRKKKR